jgi:hypothetical protein
MTWAMVASVGRPPSISLIDPALLADTYLFLGCYDAGFCHPDQTEVRLCSLLDVVVVEQPIILGKAHSAAVVIVDNPLTEHAKSVALAVDRLIVLAFWRREHWVGDEPWQVSEARLLESYPAEVRTAA